MEDTKSPTTQNDTTPCPTPCTTSTSSTSKRDEVTVTETTPPSANTSNINTKDIVQHKHQDDNPLKVKQEFILSTTHPIQTPIMDSRSNNTIERNPKQQQQQENRHKKNKRELKKRTRENDSSSLNICKSISLGKECPFGDSCRFNHDLKEVLSKREEDIKEIGICPHFELKGFCPYGLSCRAGSSHINMATGQNIFKSDEEIERLSKTHSTEVMNVIPKNVVDQLRKKKYKFVCKRFNEREKNNNKKMNGTTGSNSKLDDAKKKLEEVAVEEDNINEQNRDENNHDNSGNILAKDQEEVANEDNEVSSSLTPSTSTTTTTVATAKSNTSNGGTNVNKTIIDLTPLPTKRKLIDFSNKVYVAPLTTVGNLPFRRIMKKFGADITCGEMAVATNLLAGKNSEWALFKRHPDEDVFGVQIAAGHADVYTRIAEVIENENLDIDFVDMNLGCPIDVLCNQGCGAKLMLRENKLRDSLKGMLNVLSIPVTVKIRTGWHDAKPFAHKLVPKIQQWGNDGLGAVMLHGRSRLQRYSKLADWDYIQEVADAQSNDLPKIPIIGNGDIFSYIDYEEKVLKHNGLSQTAMIGRGALIKPWLPTEIKERRHWDISASERLDFLKEFVRFGLEHWGSDQQGVNTTRRFLLEWLSFLYRYVPVGMLEVLPQSMNQRPPLFMCGRNDLETLMLSKNPKDWVKLSEMLLGPVPDGFEFEAKHKAKSYQ